MGGPMSDYRLAKIFHREHEAYASQYWGRGVEREPPSRVPLKARRVLEHDGLGLGRLLCAVTRVGVSLNGCEATE